jgi:hypothetical protein
MMRGGALSFILGMVGAVFVASAHAAGSGHGGDAWQVALFSGVFAGVSFFGIWRNFRRCRAIEDTPTAKVASAPQGEVELSGTAVAVQSKTQVCPLTGTSCLWYFFKVERYERRGKNSQWVTISSGRSTDVFGLRDDTGTTLVVPMNAEVSPRRHRQWRGSSPSPTTGFEEKGILSHFGNYRYTEDLILPEDHVYVLGWFETLSGLPSSGPNLNEKLRELKQNPKELLARFDTNKDGDISLDEWDAARASIEKEMHQEASKVPPVPDVHTIHSPPPESDMPFLISSLSQEEVAGTYKRRAGLWLVVFLACGAVAVGILF